MTIRSASLILGIVDIINPVFLSLRMGTSFEVGLRPGRYRPSRHPISTRTITLSSWEETGTRSFSRDNAVCRKQSPSNRIQGEKVTPRVCERRENGQTRQREETVGSGTKPMQRRRDPTHTKTISYANEHETLHVTR